MERRILFIKFGKFSHINRSVLEILKKEYSDYEIDIVDAWQVLKNKISIFHYMINIFFFIAEYGKEIVLGQKKWKQSPTWFFATSYLSIRVSKFLKKIGHEKKYVFTFQTQSIFNGKLTGIPHFIYTDHTTKTNLLYPDINPKQYIRSKRFIKRSELKIYQDATMIFTLGSLPAFSLTNQYGIKKEKVAIAFAGSNTTAPTFNNAGKYYSKNILFVGMAWERKGGPILLKAFSKILQKHPDATLTIVGCNPRNIPYPNCKIIGKVSSEEVAKYYNESAIFCLPTIREPFGIVFIEAMNYRLPVIANNIGCLPDMVINDYNGYLINNNVDEYAIAICRLLENPEKCKQMGERGHQYAQEKFTWERVGKTIKTNIDKFL